MLCSYKVRESALFLSYLFYEQSPSIYKAFFCIRYIIHKCLCAKKSCGAFTSYILHHMYFLPFPVFLYAFTFHLLSWKIFLLLKDFVEIIMGIQAMISMVIVMQIHLAIVTKLMMMTAGKELTYNIPEKYCFSRAFNEQPRLGEYYYIGSALFLLYTIITMLPIWLLIYACAKYNVYDSMFIHIFICKMMDEE